MAGWFAMNSTSSRNRRITVAARAAVALLLALTLSGCIKMDVDLTLDGDKADGSMIIGVNRALLNLTGSSVEQFLAEIDAGDDIPEGATTRPYEDDVYVGQEYLLDDVDITELDNEVISINHDAEAGIYEVTGEMDMTELGPEASELGDFDVSVSITFPGEVTDHNGTLDGQTVTWTPVLGEVNEMHATARDAGGSGLSPVLLIAIAAVVVASLAGLALLLARRSRATGGVADVDDSGVPDDVSPPAGSSAVDPATTADMTPLDSSAPREEVAVAGEPGEPGEAPSPDRPAGV